MKRLITVAGALVLLAFAPCARAGQTIEIAASADSEPVPRISTSKDLLLVLPPKFFRGKSDEGISVPYIAELYYTIDGGGTWESHGFFKDLDKPFEFTAQAEGRYGFFVTLLDQRGNYDAIPSEKTVPQVTVLVDWTDPQVAITAPVGGEIAGGPSPLSISWQAADAFLASSPITLEYTSDGGQAWHSVAKGIDNSGTYVWALPEGLNGRVLIRATALDEAGHAGSAVTTSPILVDTSPPTAAVAGPALAAGEAVALDVRSDDGEGSGVAEVRLWSSGNNGANWSPAGKAAPGQPLEFRGATGRYGLYASAVDKAGNEGPGPQPGERPQLTVDIDTNVPIVRLKTLVDGGSIPGGSQTPIEWQAVAPKPAERPVSIFVSPDGGNTWSTVAAEIENSGCFVWDVPAINSPNCVLKVTIKDAGGVVGEAVSPKTFTIDSTRPTSAIGVPPALLSQPVVDLSTILRPATGAAEAPETMTGAEAPAEVPPAGAAATEGEALVGRPQSTPAPDEPWTRGEQKPFTGEILSDTSLDGVLKAAFAAYKAGQLATAREYFKKAAAIDPKDARPHAALGRVYAREAGFNYTSHKESFEAALYEFDRALELGGDDPDVYNDKGYVLLVAKRYKDAEKSFAKATQLGGKSIYWCNLGIALLRLGKRDDARAAFGKALDIEPEMKEASFYMGDVSAAQGKWQDARKYYGKAVEGYGANSSLGKLALAAIQRAREQLGEVEAEKQDVSIRQQLDRIR